MTQTFEWTTDGHPTEALQRLLAALLDKELVQGVLVPTEQRHGHVVMQSLITNPARIGEATPLAPVVWTNAGRLLASLTHKPAGAKVAAVLRSCEVRAFVELTKLNQGNRENVLLIGLDCYGRFENRDYLKLVHADGNLTTSFLSHMSTGADAPFADGFDLSRACRACEYPVAPNVDIRICLIGADVSRAIWLEALSPSGEEVLAAVGATACDEPPQRRNAVQALEKRRTAHRDEMLAAYGDKTASAQGLLAATAACINCYNCRVACPVCYCRECVFVTDLFRHDSAKYLMWSRKKGILKMPTDTVFYHLTRMVHMSTLCVGCGQCSSACPNDIDVMELFRTTAMATQARFEYVPGRDFNEKQPMATFHEDELQDAGGK